MSNHYPNKTVRIIVPLPEGGPADVLARLIGSKLTAIWGQQVVVENRVGGESIPGTLAVAKAPPDGYTLLVVPSQFTVHPHLRKDLPYDVVRDFAPVILMALSPNVLAVHPSVPANTVRDLVKLAQDKPGTLRCASGGPGTTSLKAAQLFEKFAKVTLKHVAYVGAGTATNAVLSGEDAMLFSVMSPTVPQVQSGKLRALAVTGPKRSRAIPDVPTMEEAGIAGYELTTWQGLLAPAATDKAIIAKLNADFAAVLRMPDVQQHLMAQGFDPVQTTPEEFAARIKKEVETPL